jgi:site-specific DNA-methyltransferase (adenine-specific)
VLDPFSGSATTLAVAKKLGRRFLGFDLSADYVRRGTERLAAVRVGEPLDGTPEPTLSAPASSGDRRTMQKGASPLSIILEESAAHQKVLMGEVFDRGVVEAFHRVREGFSADRVVADPTMNEAFADACRQIGIMGDIRAWNHRLLGLRKAGKLANQPTTRRTEFSWEECDSFLFASEIAWREMLDAGCESLDDIFCEPDSAKQFDELASCYAPGFSSLMYRWGALKLRKESKRARTRSELLSVGKFGRAEAIASRTIAAIPPTAGIYLVRKAQTRRPLYVGEALNLRSRLRQQFGENRAKSWKRRWGVQLEFAFFGVERDPNLLLAYQSLCVQRHSPQLNIPELAVV